MKGIINIKAMYPAYRRSSSTPEHTQGEEVEFIIGEAVKLGETVLTQDYVDISDVNWFIFPRVFIT